MELQSCSICKFLFLGGTADNSRDTWTTQENQVTHACCLQEGNGVLQQDSRSRVVGLSGKATRRESGEHRLGDPTSPVTALPSCHGVLLQPWEKIPCKASPMCWSGEQSGAQFQSQIQLWEESSYVHNTAGTTGTAPYSIEYGIWGT